MKFKALVVIINIVLIFTFLFLFFVSFILGTPALRRELWPGNLIMAAILLSVLAILNSVFIKNRAVMDFLEKEDWPGLAHHLEVRVLGRGMYGRRNVRLLLESLVVLGDFKTIEKLAAQLKSSRPRLHRELASSLSGAFILAGKYALASETATSALVGSKGLRREDRAWLGFYRGLSLYMARLYGEALEEFMPLCGESDDPLITAISGYLCSVSGKRAGKADEDPVGPDCSARISAAAAAEAARERVRARISRKAWNRYVDRAKEDIRIVILGSLINQAGVWLYE